MPDPVIAMTLNPKREIVQGSVEKLNGLIAAGADLKVSTGFTFNEHIDINAKDDQTVIETSTFAQTVIIDNHWSAAFMTLRQPVELPHGFGHANSLSLFLYNQNGLQAMAKLILDGQVEKALNHDTDDFGYVKNHLISMSDQGTLGVSRNFIYDFDFMAFSLDDTYKELYANSKEGLCVGGSIDVMAEAYAKGRGIKLAVSDLSEALWGKSSHSDEHFLPCASSYYLTREKVMITNSLPFISVPADIPLTYKTRSYKYCWLVARSDGRVEIRSYSPFENKWLTQAMRTKLRWFASR